MDSNQTDQNQNNQVNTQDNNLATPPANSQIPPERANDPLFTPAETKTEEKTEAPHEEEPPKEAPTQNPEPPQEKPAEPQATIEVGQYDTPTSPPVTPETPTPPPPAPPTSNNDHAAAKTAVVIGVVTVLFLGLGFGGGYLSYEYYPKIASRLSTSADENQENSNNSVTAPQKTGNPSENVSAWSNYENAKYNYSIKYPDTWYGQGVSDSEAKTVLFSSFDPEEESTSGYKIEIVIQDANGKNLKDWVQANNVVSANTKKEPESIKVDSETAYQQVNKDEGTTETFIGLEDQVMIITYFGPQKTFDTGEKIYDKVITSIKLS